MNLYRSFGNLLEAYVADGGMYSADVLTWTEYSNETTPASTPDIEINPRSESDDSGVEVTISSPADSSPSSAGNTEPQPMSVPTDGEERCLTPSSTLTSALRSSAGSSMRSSVSSASLSLPVTDASAAPLDQDTSVSLQHRVERALLKINPSWRKTRSGSSPNFNAQRRVSKKSLSLPRRITAAHTARSESTPAQLLLRQAGHQRSDRQRRAVSLYHDRGLVEKPIQVGAQDPRAAPGPGLSYLEEVCQMWEEIARLHIYNRQLQAEMEALEDHREAPLGARPCGCEAAPGGRGGHGARPTHLDHFQHTYRWDAEEAEDRLQWRRPDTEDPPRTGSPAEAEALAGHLRGLEPLTRGQPGSPAPPEGPAHTDQNQGVKGSSRGGSWGLRRKASSRKEVTSVDSDRHQSRPSEAWRKSSHRLSLLLRGTRRTRKPE